ncbi:MAG: hypothetical protein J0I12_24145 [Candidatus Eremiobacteraeota bacterium]|nr:hypothetical protein [Candidatus Eremiobacteraeota bacterium]
MSRLQGVAPQYGPNGQVSPKFEDKFDSFLRDMDEVVRLKGANPTPTVNPNFALGIGTPLGPRDMAPPESGDVDCPGLASLKQTAHGCTMILARGGMFGGLVASYLFDSQKGTVEVTEMHTHQGGPATGGAMPGMSSGNPSDVLPPRRETYTLDLNNGTIEEYQYTQLWNIPTY